MRNAAVNAVLQGEALHGQHELLGELLQSLLVGGREAAVSVASLVKCCIYDVIFLARRFVPRCLILTYSGGTSACARTRR